MSSEAGPSTGTLIHTTTSVKRERSAAASDDGDERPSKRLKDEVDADQDASGDDDDEHPADGSAAPTSADNGVPTDDDDEAFAEVVEATLIASSPAREPPVVPETRSPSQPLEGDSTALQDRFPSPREGVSLAVEAEDSDEVEFKSLPRSPAPEKKSTSHVSLGTELAEYACPICFTPPTNATLTPCGHICCGSCLFSAIKIAATRNLGQEFSAKCPVCRANIPGWDGRGGGVIGLQPKVVYSF
ncbi:hypothetical protein BDZ89DRAFT_950376 [Hymenopellis radicata]|nr:hypothetical protein BDZ89DRAFT_950376 [Hymenopellis radicata]